MKHLHLLPLQNFRATVCIALLDNIISELEPSFHSLIQRSLILLFLVLRIMVNDEVYDDDNDDDDDDDDDDNDDGDDDDGTSQETIDFNSSDTSNIYLLHQELHL